MARRIQNKFANDLEERKAIGFGFPLNGNAVFNATYQTRDQIKANLINYLLTNKGERVFNPTFGADLRRLLFENIVDQTLDDLRSTIQGDIARFFPLIKVHKIEFNPIQDRNEINFILTYEIINFEGFDSINILLQ